MRSLRNTPTGSHVLLQLPFLRGGEGRTTYKMHGRHGRKCASTKGHELASLKPSICGGCTAQVWMGKLYKSGAVQQGNTCACPPKHIHMCLKLHAAVRITIQVRSMREHSSSTDLSKNRTHLNSSSTISELIPDKTKTQCATGNPMCAGTERRLCFEEGLDWRTSFTSTSMKVFFTPTAQYVMPSSSSS